MRITLVLLAVLFSSISLFAQTKLLRNPDISKTHITFEYGQDIWITDMNGNGVRRLSSEPGNEMHPNFSPDGKWIAFTGEYGGNQDVYVVSAEGGTPKRLTWHPGNDMVTGWSSDGKSVLFSSNRESPQGSWFEIFAVSTDGGMPEKLPVPRAIDATMSPDEKFLAYELVRRWDPGWRNYRGGQNHPIRLLDLKSLEETALPFVNSYDKNPHWLGSDVYFISDRDSTSNVYRYDSKSKSLEQITDFWEYDVMSINTGGGKVIFEQAGELHIYNPADKTTKTVSIEVKGDFPWAMPHWKDVSKDIQYSRISPSGKRLIVEARGEVFTLPSDKGSTRNMSEASGAADRWPTWSPDGKMLAWFSDRSGEYEVVIRDSEGLKAIKSFKLDGKGFYFTPEWSPNSNYLAYTDADLNIWILDVNSGKQTRVDNDNFTPPQRTLHPVWSPDSKWIAYSKRMESQFHAIFVYFLDSQKTTQITDLLSDAVQPAFDASGEYLWFLASTNAGQKPAGWLDMSQYPFTTEYGVYVAVLKNDKPSPFLPQTDSEISEEKKEEPKEEKSSKRSKKKSDTEAEDENAVRIDFEGLQNRILAVNVPVRAYEEVKAGEAGIVFISENIPNQSGVVVHHYDLKERKAKEFMSGISEFDISADNKKFHYRAGNVLGIVDAKGSAKVGDGKVSTSDMTFLLDPQAEWRQLLRESWRLQRDFFYVPNYHGVNLDEVWNRYAPFLDHVKHRADLTYVMDMVGAEFSVGHSYTSTGDEPGPDRVPVGLLGADWQVDGNRYKLSTIYTAESWNPDLSAPLSAPGLDVNVGNVLISVNGNDVTSDKNLFSYFEQTAGKVTHVVFADNASGKNSRGFYVEPISNDKGLRTRKWVEDNRRKVDELSGGKLAYVWLPNTGNGGYTYFNRYYFAQQHKQGAVIDERWNGGGSAADYFVDVMTRKLHGYFNNPVGDRTPFPSPGSGIWGPKVMIINEMAGSGGDYLPFMFRKENVGKLVGSQTWGGLVGIWDTQRLIDGGRITNPRGGFFNLQGEWDVENKGIAPDIDVFIDAKSYSKGIDPQLHKAVEVALEELKNNPPKVLTKEPEAPVRSVRGKRN